MFVLEVPGSARIFKKDASSVQRDLEMSPRSQSFEVLDTEAETACQAQSQDLLFREGGGERGGKTQ